MVDENKKLIERYPFLIPCNVDTGKEVSIDELEAEEPSQYSEVLSRLTALSEAWKDLKENETRERPNIPLVWSVDDTGMLLLDNVWVCPARYLNTEQLTKEDRSEFVSDVTIVLPLAEGTLDLIIVKEFGDYEFSIVERRV